MDDGLLEAAGVDAVLLSRCELPEQCEWYWIDRHSGERIDRRVPDTDHRHWVGEVFGPDDRFLILHDQGPGQTYFDTVTGAYLSGAYRPQGDRPAGVAAEAISPDGRYLLVPDGDGVIVYDLQAGTSALLPVEIPGSPLRVEFMPKPADRSMNDPDEPEAVELFDGAVPSSGGDQTESVTGRARRKGVPEWLALVVGISVVLGVWFVISRPSEGTETIDLPSASVDRGEPSDTVQASARRCRAGRRHAGHHTVDTADGGGAEIRD